MKPLIGVLALQGDFAAHAAAVERAGGEPREIRTPDDLQGVRGLILPGGESTTLLRLLRQEGLDRSLREFHASGGAILGTCAGLILLAGRVSSPEQESLALCDVDVLRNGYGRQVDSFVGRGRITLPGAPEAESEMFFIRAPRITRVGPEASVLGRLEGGEPVLIAQGRILGATYHPEMSSDNPVHPYFVRLAGGNGARPDPAARP